MIQLKKPSIFQWGLVVTWYMLQVLWGSLFYINLFQNGLTVLLATIGRTTTAGRRPTDTGKGYRFLYLAKAYWRSPTQRQLHEQGHRDVPQSIRQVSLAHSPQQGTQLQIRLLDTLENVCHQAFLINSLPPLLKHLYSLSVPLKELVTSVHLLCHQIWVIESNSK